MGISFVNEGLKALKILVTSNNQICLNALEETANSTLRDFISTKSRMNHNGGMLMHFLSEDGIRSSIDAIKAAMAADDKADIKVLNYQPPENPS